MASQPRPTEPHPLETQGEVRKYQAALKRIAAAIIRAHHAIWPQDINGSYRVIHRNGKAKVEFNPSQHLEPGWRDE